MFYTGSRRGGESVKNKGKLNNLETRLCIDAVLREISDSYEWFDRVAGLILDSYILAGNTVSTEWLERALADISSLPNLRTLKSDLHTLADGSSGRASGVRTNNVRIRAWKDFLAWALYPQNYCSGTDTTNDADSRAIRREVRFELELFFEEFRRQEPTTGRRSGLTGAEIEATALAIVPDENGFPPGKQFAENNLSAWVWCSVSCTNYRHFYLSA